MIPDLGKYTVEVLAAYGVSIALLIGLVLGSVRRSRNVKARLAAVEAAQGENPVKWLLMIPVILFAAFAGLFAAGMFLGQGDELPSALIGKAAPVLQVSEIESLPEITDDMLRDGEVKIVNFWASWCAPCRVEHPNLMALANEGVPIYGINYKDFDPKCARVSGRVGKPVCRRWCGPKRVPRD